ncbi:MAG: AMP-binding protein [Fimbriimonadaceae bacterium]|nr:AMP-binding protein [Alphaproteobacteria bacterium]
MAENIIYWRKELECLPRDQLLLYQLQKLRMQLRHVYSNSPFYKRKFDDAGIKPDDIRTMDDVQEIPFTEKEELRLSQEQYPPWGDFCCIKPEQGVRVFQTSGTTGQPVKVMLSRKDWYENYYEQFQHFRCGFGLTEKDILFVPFNYGMYIAWWGFQSAMEQAGLMIIPGGGLRSKDRLTTMLDWRATAICGTPSYLLYLAEIARENNIDLANSPIAKLIVAGEPGANVPATKRMLETSWGAECFDDIGSTEISNFGYECIFHAGTHVAEDMFIAECLDTDSLEPLSDGETGELILTNLICESMPLIRYRTRDLVKFNRAKCDCGRTNLRLDGGILGRSDDMFHFAGVNVFPTQIEDLLRTVDEFSPEYQLKIPQMGSGRHLRICVEPACHNATSVQLNQARDRLVDMVKSRITVTPEVEIMKMGSLPRFEGKAKRIIRE